MGMDGNFSQILFSGYATAVNVVDFNYCTGTLFYLKYLNTPKSLARPHYRELTYSLSHNPQLLELEEELGSGTFAQLSFHFLANPLDVIDFNCTISFPLAVGAQRQAQQGHRSPMASLRPVLSIIRSPSNPPPQSQRV